MFRTSPVADEDEWHLDLEVEDHVATLTLNNPDKLNAWSWESTRQLGALADQIRFDERVRAVVLRGEGRAFCAGIDLGMPEDRVTGRSPAEKARNYYEGIRWAHERFKVFAELPQPVVAAVQGYCFGFGFGFELVLMADVRIAANAPLAVQSIKRTIDSFTYRAMTEAMRFAAMSASIEFVSDDMPAGYAAKAAKKTIVFEGK